MSTNIEVKQGGGFTIFFIVLILVLAGSCIYLYNDKKQVLTENEKLSGNLTALTDSFSAYIEEINDSTDVLVAETKRITLDRDDWKDKYREEYNTSRKLKLRKVESVTNIEAEVEDSLPVETIIFNPIQGIDSLFFASEFMKADVAINHYDIKDSKLHYIYSPSLTLFNSFEQRKFLFFNIGKKFKKSTLVSADTCFRLTKFDYKEVVE